MNAAVCRQQAKGVVLARDVDSNIPRALPYVASWKALNTLMGREVYTSNEQLGGPGVMGSNGVSHLLVDSHVGAISSALRWLSYVPRSRGSYLPVVSDGLAALV